MFATLRLCRSNRTYMTLYRQLPLRQNSNGPFHRMTGLLKHLTGTQVTLHTSQRQRKHRRPSSHVVLSRCLSSAAAENGYSLCRDPETGDAISVAEHYKKYGFVIAKDLLSHHEVSSLMEEMLDICRGKRGSIPGMVSSDCEETDEEVLQKYLCIHFPHKISEKISGLVKEPKTVSVLQQCIGPNVKAMQTMMFMKGPGKRGQACHQDEYYIPTRDRSLCASWVALDDATIENGCIWIIPKSHQRGIIYPMNDQHNDERFDSSGESIGYNYPDSAWQPVELRSGSAVFFNGYLLHRSLPNKSNWFRRAFANHYMSAESLLPWTNDGRFDIKDDMRDFIMVCGKDPYADLKPQHSFTQPFVRAEVRKQGAVFNEVI